MGSARKLGDPRSWFERVCSPTVRRRSGGQRGPFRAAACCSSDVSELVGDVRRDAPDELSVLGTKLGEALGGSGLVSGPLLSALVIPGPGEALGGLVEVGCSGVDVAGVPGAAHGHIGELPATTVVEDVGDFDRRALGAMSGDGVAVGEAVGADVVERPSEAGGRRG